MIKVEIIKSGRGWMDRFHQSTIRQATLDALRDELPRMAEDARRNTPVSPRSKEHLRDTVGYGIDREKGYGYLKAGGTFAVWYAHLIERGFTDRAGRFHRGRRFMGRAIEDHSQDVLVGLRRHLERRLSHG